MDVATRIRLTGLLLNENRYNKDASLEESLFFYFGGPAFSTVKRIEQGFKDASDGKVERSIENFLPPGIANIYKIVPTPISGRLTREGYETRRGDPIFDDVTGGDLAANNNLRNHQLGRVDLIPFFRPSTSPNACRYSV